MITRNVTATMKSKMALDIYAEIVFNVYYPFVYLYV